MREVQQLKEITEIAIQFSSEKRSAQLFSLIKQADYLPLEPPDLRVAVALACGWPERLADDGPEVVPELLAAWKVSSTGKSAEQALVALRTTSSRDTLCEEWINSYRETPQLLELIKQINHLPQQATKLRVAVALACGWPERLADDGPEVVPAVLEACAISSSREAAISAILALRTPAAIDTLCRYWMETGTAGDNLATLLVSAGHSPSEPDERALFWLLIGQIQRYEELDLDGTLLVQGQAAASTNVRKRFAAAAALAGRMEWLGAMQQSKPLDQFDTDDWTTTVELLKRAGDPNAIWHWALKAPPTCAQELLKMLPACTLEDPQTKETTSRLQRLAGHLPEVPHRHHLIPNFCTQTLSGHLNTVCSIAWSPDGRCLASGGHSTIRLWDPARGACTHTLSGHSDRVWSIAWSPDGRCIASGSSDHTIRLWDPASGRCTHTISGNIRRGGLPFAWSPDGRCLASCDYDTIRLWDPATGSCIHTLSGHLYEVLSIAWSTDGRCLASCSCDSTIRLWNPASGACAHTLSGHVRPVKSIVWSPDGRCLTSLGLDNSIRLWNPASGACTHTLSGLSYLDYLIAWSPDGRCIASGRLDQIRLWDPASGDCTHTLTGHSGHVDSIAWSPDGRCLASGSGDKTIRLWDPATGACTHTLSGHSASVRSIAWSPDGSCIASGSENDTIRLWVDGFISLLSTPLACYGIDQWNLLSDLQKQIPELKEWQRSWLAFIAALGTVIRRFDVNVDDVATQPAASPFEVEIDG
jgi:WD40 repeat protein